MTDFEKVLQECLGDLEQGAATVNECLRRHPEHALQLEPILLASAYLESAGRAQVSEAFKARVRARLIEQMYARPRRSARSSFPFFRLAMGLAVLLLALLATGTVYAQSALPGESFYAWKLASERAWRALSPDPVETDLAIAERRVDELIAVRDDMVLYAQVLQAYVEVADRLRDEMDAETEALIRGVLETQIEELNQAGIFLNQSESDPEVAPPVGQPTPMPAATPLPVLPIPEAHPTALPVLAPTIEVPEPTNALPAEILPTVQDLPKIIPTIEIPPPIP